jgi:hemerythrin-like domain-containing protein
MTGPCDLSQGPVRLSYHPIRREWCDNSAVILYPFNASTECDVISKIPSRTDPVRQLIDEHEIFMDALGELRRIMSSLPEGTLLIPPDDLASIQEIWHVVNEHLNVHFVKEEVVFFPMIERMIPGSRVKFQFLHIDHERLRENFEEFTIALQNYRAQGQSVDTVTTFWRLGEEMIRWFFYHIVAEDTIYFEIAGEEMDPTETAAVLKQMEQIESELRETLPPDSDTNSSETVRKKNRT